MKKYSNILFDLDGTLSDPRDGIVSSVAYALSKINIREHNRVILEKFIGPPLTDSFARYYQLDAEGVTIAIAHYRDYYEKKGIFQNIAYDGMGDLLQGLRNEKKRLFVATSKLEAFAVKVVGLLGFKGHFDGIAGSNPEGTVTSKTDVIASIFSRFPDISRDDTLMIGDMSYDIVGAQNNFIDSVGVTYGYGSKEELEKARPTYIASSVEDLRRLLLH